MADESFFDYIKSETGIDVDAFTGSVSDLLRRGFRKLSPEELAKVSSLLQYAPQFVAQKIAEGRIQASFAEATKDTFRLVMDTGRHLAKSSKNPGLFSSNTFDAANKNMKPAVWALNETELTVSGLENLVANSMSIASFITGQYFMSQINAAMSSLNGDVRDIRSYIEADKRSEFEANVGWMETQARHMQYILKDDMRRQNAVQDVGRMNQYFVQTIAFCRDRVKATQGVMGVGDSYERIVENMRTLCKYLRYYSRALTILCDGLNMEIGLNRIVDIEELDDYLTKDMKLRINEYHAFFGSVIKWMNKYVDAAPALNKLSTTQNLLSYGKGVLSAAPYVLGLGGWGLPAGAMAAYNRVSDSQKRYSDDIAKRRKDLIAEINGDLEICRDPRYLDAATSMLERLLSAAKRTEFVKVGNDVYTNMPLARSSGA